MPYFGFIVELSTKYLDEVGIHDLNVIVFDNRYKQIILAVPLFFKGILSPKIIITYVM